MATLDNSNIVNGNIIQPNDILQLYSAFTAGGGYDVSISGSLTGSATSASFAISSSRAVTASFAISSSRAVTASFALNAASSPNTINVIPQGEAARSMYPIAGFATFGGGTSTSASVPLNSFSPAPVATVLGTDIWVTANSTDDPAPSIRIVINGGNLEFFDDTATYSGGVIYTGYIKA